MIAKAITKSLEDQTWDHNCINYANAIQDFEALKVSWVPSPQQKKRFPFSASRSNLASTMNPQSDGQFLFPLITTYCIAGNLAVWWFAFATAKLKFTNISYLHIRRSHTKPPNLNLPIFLQWWFWAKLPNLIHTFCTVIIFSDTSDLYF